MKNTIDAVAKTLAAAAVLVALSAPAVNAAPGDGPGTEPSDPNVPSDPFPSLALPAIQVSPNPVVCYGNDNQTTTNVTWPPYPWGPVQLAFDNVGGPQYVGNHPPVGPSETETHALLDMPCGRTLQVYLKSPWPGKLKGPKVTVTTVQLGVVPSDPQPPRINPTLIPGVIPLPEPPATQRP
jgi:hypothetical protein